MELLIKLPLKLLMLGFFFLQATATAMAREMVDPWSAGPEWHGQVTLEPGRVDRNALLRMQARLGTRLTDENMESRCYERRRIGQLIYRYCFEHSLVLSNWDTTVTEPFPWRDETLALKPQKAFLRYGFAARMGDGRGWDSRNLALFLNSAYHQELYPGYAKADSNFLPPIAKSQWGLWSRGAVSMGWGAHYVAEGNPFATGEAADAVKWLLYSLDAVFYIGMAVAAAGGLDSDERLDYILQAKGLHTGISFAIFTPLLGMELSETLRIRDSGYRMPVGMLFRW